VLRDIVVSSQKDKMDFKWKSEREGTFYLGEIYGKVQKSLKRACSSF
jgi:hypothetical protein